MYSSDAGTDLRYEIKLVCEPHRLCQARSWVRLHPAGFRVAYPPRRVNSLYLDTRNMHSFAQNLAGLATRQKLRLRWYGDGWVDVRPLLELKWKRNLLGAKRQALLPCELDLAASWVDILGRVRANAGPDWCAFLQAADQPAALICYQREYYVTRDGAVRLTLDYDIHAYDQRLSVRPNLRRRLPVADSVVLELKAAAAHGERLEEIAGRFPLQRTRNSKYVQALLVAPG